MTVHSSFRSWGVRRALRVVAVALVVVATGSVWVPSALAAVPISGAGSTWAQTAVDQWRRDVVNQGLQVNYSGTGSSDGRRQYLNGTTDFAVSDIPFQFHPEDNSEPETPVAGSYAYMPVTAGGTVFMYNLTINGQRVTNLRLSGENVSKIFTGVLTQWNDPLIAADNPGLTLPARKIVPVVRSDGSGSSAQFSLWMINQYPQLWTSYCAKVGRQNACGFTSFYPSSSGMVAQSGDLGVSGYIAQSYGEGAIGYVNYSYALNTGFPVAKMLNRAGYYTEPTASNVAVSLSAARINTNSADPSVYLTQDLTGVYNNPDPRTYELSSYSYFILPTTVQGQFTTAKGQTLGQFSYYFMCQGQQKAEQMGYSPLPVNLVDAGFQQIRKIPGVDAKTITAAQCNNPTFSSDGHNKLIDTAPMPDSHDKLGYTGGQNSAGSGGAKSSTPVKPAAQQTPEQAPSPTSQGAPQQTAPPAAVPRPGAPAPAAPTPGANPAAPTAVVGAAPSVPAQNIGGATSPATARSSAAVRPQTQTGTPTRRAGAVTSERTAATASKPATAVAGRSAVPATAAAATIAAVAASAGCDPDSGACTGGGGLAAGQPAAVDLAAVQVASGAVPVTVPAGWGSAQTLMVIAGICVLLVFVVPPFVARRLDGGN